MSIARTLVTRRSTVTYLLGVAAALAIFLIARRSPGEPMAAALSDVAFTGFGLLALGACIAASISTPRPQRVGWRLLAAVRGWRAPRPRGPASV